MKAEVRSVLLCDDVRKEVSGKDILIGVYGGTINVNAYPALVRTSFWIEVEPEGTGEIQCHIKIGTPSGNPPINVDFTMEVPAEETAIFVMGGVPLALERDGFVEVSAKMGDAPWQVVKRKRVMRGGSGAPPPAQ